MGYQIDNDNLNLGIHEFCHVVHFNATKSGNASNAIFLGCFVKFKMIYSFLLTEND